VPFSVLGKPIGPLCNLSCRYCFYLEKEKLYPHAAGKAGWAMSDAVLDAYIRQYIEAAQDAPAVTFVWQGGEPTLVGVEFFARALEIQKKYAGGKRIENSLQTNGVLLDDRWCEFLAASRFLVGLSIDGPRALHDRYRVDRAGAPTFDKVLQGIQFLQKHGVEFNTLTVVQSDNSKHPLAVYRFLKEVGSRFLQFIPIVERDAEDEVTPWSVEPQQYGRFLCSIFDEWVRNDVGRVYVQLFDVALEAWAGLPSSLCVFGPTCGDALVVEHNGDVYSCDHYVYPQNRLGNLTKTPLEALARSQQQHGFGQAKTANLPSYCLQCRYLSACNGECPKHRFMKTPAGEPGLNYLCPAYKRFFAHVDPYMAFMAGELANQRPPANVMNWTPGPPGKIGRNDACPCGSGQKYKKCCGAL
jgi:uncharacterized protein